jgi:hypothetical protein
MLQQENAILAQLQNYEGWKGENLISDWATLHSYAHL